jgi:hypothetical protein
MLQNMNQKVFKTLTIISLLLLFNNDLKAQNKIQYQDELITVNEGIGQDSFDIYLLNCWKHFLLTKNTDYRKNYFWSKSDSAKFYYPFRELVAIENKAQQEDFYKPTVLAISNTDLKNTYIVKTAFIGDDKTIKCIFNVLAERDTIQKQNFYFRNIRDFNTRHWQTVQIGSIHYKISPLHAFNRQKAVEMDSMNKHFANYFDTELVDIQYFFCKSKKELYEIRGYDYHHAMFDIPTGGETEMHDKTIYAGNDSERYDHECVHIYTYQKFKQSIHRFLDEGIATYLGGGDGKDYDFFRGLFKKYLNTNPKTNFKQFVPNDIYLPLIIPDTDHCLPYTLSAFLCEMAIQKGGKPLLFNMLQQGDSEADFWKAMKLLDITKDNLYQKIKEALAK